VITLNAAGVAVVQSWVSTPSTNFGFIIADSGNTDGLDFISSESVTSPTIRPLLTVTYV
jgi:hypothetical protein